MVAVTNVQGIGLGGQLTVLDFIGDHSQCQRLGLEGRLLCGRAPDRDAGHLGHIANPAAIGLA